MKDAPTRRSAAPFVPDTRKLDEVRDAARGCEGCDLFANATQTVFGEGPRSARMMLVGEQPGDEEDREGAPFVGPAGRILDRALDAAGVPRGRVYLTNAVKHFAWEPRGKRRIHRKPRISEMRACWPWLQKELDLVRPRVIVCLGATATQALLGTKVTLKTVQGKVVPTPFGADLVATLHPAAVLRAPDPGARAAVYETLVEDLRRAAALLGR
jgi:DNA polymerase